MTGALRLLGASLVFALGNAEKIKIIVDNLWNPIQSDSKAQLFAFMEVSDQITVGDLIEKVNYDGKVHFDDWDFRRKFGSAVWGDDGGTFLYNAYSNTDSGPLTKMYVEAYYAGKHLRKSSTLRSYGIKEMSTVLLAKGEDAGKQLKAGTNMVYVKVVHNNKNEYLYFYRREDLWNLYNALTHRYGMRVDDSTFNVPTKGSVTPKIAAPFAGTFTTLGKIKDDTGKNPITVEVDRTKRCKCMSSSVFANNKGQMTKRLAASNYGLGCGAHDASTKVCNGKNIGKGNRECWCPRKWCYVADGCGTPSSKFPGLSFSYDICQNNDNVDCFASDTEGVEAAKLGDFDIWTFPKVTGYLSQLAKVLVDAMPSLQSKFEED